MKRSISPWAQIRNLLAVIFLGVMMAVVFAGLMLHYYNPSGRYLLRNVLLAPETMVHLQYQEHNRLTGKIGNFTFDRVAYSHWVGSQQQWHTEFVDDVAYGKFYYNLQGDSSLDNVSKSIEELFARPQAAILTIYVSDTLTVPPKQSTFQVLEFGHDGNYYRVLLREQQGDAGWAYFYHPDILALAQQLLDKKEVGS